MRAFALAISFACLLAIASNMVVTDYNSVPVAEAQGYGHWLIVSKSVQGSIPDSNWQYVWLWSGTKVSSNFFIDKAGGVTSFRISEGAYGKISELSRSGYAVSIAYGSITNNLKVTYGQVEGNVVMLGLVENVGQRTYWADFSNSYTSRGYVGGIVQPTVCSQILPLIFLLGMVVAAEALTRKFR